MHQPQNPERLLRLLTCSLIIALAFSIAQSYELYKLLLRIDQMKQEYAELEQKKTRVVYFPRLAEPEGERQLETGINTPYRPVVPASRENPTLAQRNKNPLNIKAMSGGRLWEGQIGRDEFGHAVFSSWEHGVRAASLTLRTYAKTHKIDTVEGMLRRFCTAQGKTFESYVAFVCQSLGVKRDEKIDLITRMPALLRAMARFESGMELPEELFVSYDVLALL